MSLLALAQILADVAPEEDPAAETPWVAVIILLVLAFGVVAIVIGRLRKKAAEIEEI